MSPNGRGHGFIRRIGFVALQSDLRIIEENVQCGFLVEELFGSGFYRRKVCQVNMEVQPFFARLALQILNGLLCTLLTAGCNVNFRVACEERLSALR